MGQIEDSQGPLSSRLYSHRHIARVTGLTPDVLRQWVKRRLVYEVAIEGAGAPRSKKASAGRPSREFHVWQVCHLAIMCTIRDMGVDLGRASRWSTVVVNKYLYAKAAPARPRLLVFSAKKNDPREEQTLVVPESDVAAFGAELPGAIGTLYDGACIVVDIDTIMANTMAVLRRMNEADDAAAVHESNADEARV